MNITYDSSYELPIPSRANYNFAGWWKGSTPAQLINNSGTWNMVAINVTLVAHWTEFAVYEMTFVGGEGSEGSMSADNVTEHGDYQLPNCSFTKEGYHFYKWSYNSAEYDAGDIIEDVTGSMEFLALWESDTHTVTFNPNTGQGSATQTVGHNVLTPLNTHTCTRYGYNFVRWDTNYRGTGTSYAENAEIAITEDITLYAIWEPRQITVTFDPNNGGPTYTTVITYNTNYEFDDPVYVDHNFVGWYIGTQLINSTGVWTLRENDFTLVALWKALYQISFSGGAGTEGSMDSAIVVEHNGYQLPDCTFTKAGYDFYKWSCNAIEYDVGDTIQDVTGPMEFLALWASVPAASDGEAVAFVTDGDTAIIDLSSPSVASAFADATKTSVEISGDGWTMDIPKEIVAGAAGQASVSAKVLDDAAKAALPASVKEKVAGKTVYSLDLSDSNGAISFNGKKVKVSLPYELAAGQDASNVKVFYINGEELVQYDATYDSVKKVAVFETDHFSDWFVDIVESPSSSGSNGGGFPIWIVFVIIAVVVVAGVGAFFVVKQKKA